MKFNLHLLCLCCLLLPLISGAQGIQGRVLSESGEPLPFAAILVMPGNHTTISNEQGRFELRLATGNYTIQVHFIGYKGEKRLFQVAENYLKMDLRLERQVYELAEVKVKASNEDPAYDMIRKAMAKAPLHRSVVQAYTAKSYVKGTFLVKKAPWAVRKLMEREKFKVGTTYVLESVSQLKYAQPASFSEKVLSIRSNLPPAANGSRINYATYSFYNPTVAGLTSPIGPDALRTYRYRFAGSRQEGDDHIVKIEVFPKVPGEGVVKGVLYLVAGNWNIHSLDFAYIDGDGNDYKFRQQYQQLDELWMPTKLDIELVLSYLGAQAHIRYLTSVRDYKLTANPKILAQLKKPAQAVVVDDNSQARKAFKTKSKELEKLRNDSVPKNEVLLDYRFEIDTLARIQPDSVWDELRQVPLEEQELLGYRQADTLYAKAREKQLKEEANPNKFYWSSAFTSYSYHRGRKIEDTHYPYEWYYEGPFTGFIPKFDFYNAVEGLVLQNALELRKAQSLERREVTRLDLRYAFGRNRLIGSVKHEQFYPKGQWSVAGGIRTSQLNSNDPIHPFINSLYTLLDRQHLMPLYEKTFLSVAGQRRISAGIRLELSAEWALRRSLPLSNRLALFPDETVFGSSMPFNQELGVTGFTAHQAFRFQYAAVWRPGARLASYNGREYVTARNQPAFRFEGISGYAGTYFQEIKISAEHNWRLGKGRQIDYQLTTGGFLAKPRYIPDLHHFDGNQTWFMARNPFRFRSLDYYRYSTTGNYVQAFASYRTRRLLLTQLEICRQYGLDEVLFLNSMATANYQYLEYGYRIDGIARLFGLDAFVGIGPQQQPGYGLRLKIGL